MRIVCLCVLWLLFASSCAGSQSADDRTREKRRPSSESSLQVPQRFPWKTLPRGWSKLPPPPYAATDAASVWTGSELIYWGGESGYGGTAHDEGAAFDPESMQWRDLPNAPISARSSPGAVWTGAEMLIWGGSGEAPLDTGAAYSPAHDTWRSLAPSPLEPRDPVAVAWSGSEMIVWGSTSRPDGAVNGAAYDPLEDRWRDIADAPSSLNLVTTIWTGDEMIVFGGLLDNNNASGSDHAQGVAYDPESDTWRVLPTFPLSPQASTAAWTGSEMIVWDYGLSAGAFDPDTNRWRKLPDVPLDPAECYPTSAFSEYLLVGHYCSTGIRFDADLDQWERFDWPGGIVAGRPVAADGAFLFAGATHESRHNMLWVYKPDRDPDWPECGVIDLTSDDYGTRIEPVHGPPGTTVSLSGTTVRGEDGRWAPSDRLEAWWNTSVPALKGQGGTPIKDGPALRLVTVDDMERCSFAAEFTIPNIDPGNYEISVLVWDDPPSEGYGFFLPHRFTVTGG